MLVKYREGRIDNNWQIEVTLNRFAVDLGNLEIESNPNGLDQINLNSNIEMAKLSHERRISAGINSDQL